MSDLSGLDTKALQERRARLRRDLRGGSSERLEQEMREIDAVLATRGGLHLLDYASSNKILVIKAIREITGLGLWETKELVESALPVLVASGTRASVVAERDLWVEESLDDLEKVATVEWRAQDVG